MLNCDAYQNWDFTSENKRGGNVDGFGFHVSEGSVGNVFRGCRAWCNSDDGFDFITTTESVTVDNCWAFYNGYNAKFEKLADGNGFKAGGYAATPLERLPKVLPRHVIQNCLAVRNKAAASTRIINQKEMIVQQHRMEELQQLQPPESHAGQPNRRSGP